MCCFCLNHNLVMSLFMTHHRIYHQNLNMRNTKGVTSRAGTTYPSRTPEFTPVFNDVCVVPWFLSNALWTILCLNVFSFCLLQCLSSIDRFWLPVMYIQTFLMSLFEQFLQIISRWSTNLVYKVLASVLNAVKDGFKNIIKK